VWYLLKVDVLAAAVIFAGAGLVIVVLFAWQQTKEWVESRRGPSRIAHPESGTDILGFDEDA
jgi:hypothetical protein